MTPSMLGKKSIAAGLMHQQLPASGDNLHGTARYITQLPRIGNNGVSRSGKGIFLSERNCSMSTIWPQDPKKGAKNK